MKVSIALFKRLVKEFSKEIPQYSLIKGSSRYQKTNGDISINLDFRHESFNMNLCPFQLYIYATSAKLLDWRSKLCNSPLNGLDGVHSCHVNSLIDFPPIEKETVDHYIKNSFYDFIVNYEQKYNEQSLRQMYIDDPEGEIPMFDRFDYLYAIGDSLIAREILDKYMKSVPQEAEAVRSYIKYFKNNPGDDRPIFGGKKGLAYVLHKLNIDIA